MTLCDRSRHVISVPNRHLTGGEETWGTGAGVQEARRRDPADGDEGPSQDALFTPQELAKFDGRQKNALYVAILGRVYDVSASGNYFGKGKIYASFTGQWSSGSSLN